MKWLRAILPALILLLAAVLRLTGLDWDGYQHHHPDERYISWVAATIEFPSLSGADWRRAFDPQTSGFNPFYWSPEAASAGIETPQDRQRDFAYGHVPLYLGVGATRFAERLAPFLLPRLPAAWRLSADVLNGAGRIEFHHLTIVARALTALFDVVTVGLVFLLGRKLYGWAVGLLAATLLALTVLHIQLAHFFTSDPYLTFFTLASLCLMTLAVEKRGAQRSWVYLLLAGAVTGLAVGSKFAAVLLLLPLGWTARQIGDRWSRRVLGLVAAGLAGLIVFSLTNPFAVLDRTCNLELATTLPGLPDVVSVRSCYLTNVLKQNAMVGGRSDLGFTRQYEGTLPYLYFTEMLFRWGMGPLLTVVGFLGLVWVTGQTARPVHQSAFHPAEGEAAAFRRRVNTVLLLWAWPYFITTGLFYVKYMRYMQPLLPLLALFGSAMLSQWSWKLGRRAVTAVLVVSTGLYALAFVAIYGQPHPWNAASQWIYRNVRPGSLILSEQWDDYLPATMPVGDRMRRREEYDNAELSWLTGSDARDNETKLAANLELLASADYVSVLSNRVYGVLPRQLEAFPLSGQYHQLLFDGRLGYEPAWVGGRFPRLLGLYVKPDTFGWPGLHPPVQAGDYLAGLAGFDAGRADESFIVYDQPLTILFRNTGRLTAAEMRALFEPAPVASP